MGESRSYFSLLSYEMVVDIFDYLSHTDRKKCRLICHRWRILLDNCGKYFSFRAILSNVTQKQFCNSYRTMEYCTMKNYTNTPPENGHYPKICHAILGWRNSEKNMTDFFKFGFGDVKSLTITKFSLGQCIGDRIAGTLKDVSWQNLSQLKLDVILVKYKFERVVNHVEATILLLKLARLPKVRELELELTHKYEPQRSKALRALRFHQVILALYEFLANHAKTLKSLHCSIVTTRRPRRWFAIPEIPDEMREAFATDLNLRQISLKFCRVKRIEAMITPELFGSALKSVKFDTAFLKLKKFPPRWRQLALGTAIDTDFNTLEININRIFANNGKSLQNVTFLRFPLVNFSWFQKCCVLTSVEIDSTSISQRPQPSTYPTDIFEPSAKFLRKVCLLEFKLIDLSWFKNCINLEILEIPPPPYSTIQTIQGWQNLPPIHLKKLYICCWMCTNEEFQIEFQDFINRFGETLEELVIYCFFPISLRKCLGLKRLTIHGYTLPIQFNQPTNHSFQHLTSYRGFLDFNQMGDESFFGILTNLMPNLKSIGYFRGYNANGLALQQVFRMPNLVEVVIENFTQEKLVEIVKLCKSTKGLSYKESLKAMAYGFRKQFRIFADRLVYNIHEP